MALTATPRGTGSGSSSPSFFNVTSNCTPGALIYLFVELDNSNTGGTDPSTLPWSDGLGNTWTHVTNVLQNPSATANTGCALQVFSTNQNAGTLLTSTNVFTSGWNTVNPTIATWAFWEVTSNLSSGSTGKGVHVTSGIANGKSTTPSVTTSSIPAGDMVIGVVGFEAGTAQTITGDSDTTNGSWSAQQTTSIGTGTAGGAITTQAKLTTGTGTQTYNPTINTSENWCTAWVQITESVTFNGTVPVLSTPMTGLTPSFSGDILNPSVTWFDRVVETCTVTGAGGVYTPTGAANSGYVTFTGNIPDGQYIPYCAEFVDTNGVPNGAWERGIAQWSLSGGTLTRVFLLGSSTGVLINWTSGTKRISLDMPSEAVRLPDIQIFTSTGNWYKPQFGMETEVYNCGQGGGGASGANRLFGGGGGGAGAAGGVSYMKIPTANLPNIVTVTCNASGSGTGGTGGTGVTATNTTGNSGTAGSATTFGNYLTAPGGPPGVGVLSVSAASTASTQAMWVGGNGAAGGGSSGGVGSTGSSVLVGPGGGGGGGSYNGSSTDFAGGAGGSRAINYDSGGAGAAGIAPGGNAGNGGGVLTGLVPFGGAGGGGGASSSTGNGGNGGNGGNPGGGGGGGGSGATGFTSGAGGNGGLGQCVAITR